MSKKIPVIEYDGYSPYIMGVRIEKEYLIIICKYIHQIINIMDEDTMEIAKETGYIPIERKIINKRYDNTYYRCRYNSERDCGFHFNYIQYYKVINSRGEIFYISVNKSRPNCDVCRGYIPLDWKLVSKKETPF